MLDLPVELSSVSFFICLITEAIFVLSSISSGLEFWSIYRISIYIKIMEKFFRNIRFWGEISNNWPNDLLGLLNFVDDY